MHNLEIIDFNFWATIKYWPLLIILVGINLIAQNKTYGSYIKIGCNVLFLGWILYVGMSAPTTSWTERLYNSKHVNTYQDHEGEPLLHAVSQPFDSRIKESVLEFTGGVSKFKIQTKDGADLVAAKSETNDMGMHMETSQNETQQKVVIHAKPMSRRNKAEAVLIDLHPDVLWKLDLSFGAANIEGSLSDLRFKNIEINTGASNMSLTLGTPKVGISKIDIATGASKIHFRIPKDAAVKVEYTSILSKNSFEGFETNESGVAKTANYEEAKDKFDIGLEGAANNFTISRY